MPDLEPQIAVPMMPGPMLHNMAMAPPTNLLINNDPKILESLVDKEETIEWESTSERMKETTKLPHNLLKLLSGRWTASDTEDCPEPNLEVAANLTSPSSLEKIENEIEMADLKCFKRLLVPRPRLVPLVREMSNLWPKSSIQLSGMFLYPEGGGYMGWHTNSDSPCTRVYISNVKEGGKSFFRYRLDGEYVTSWDKAGWNMRCFEVTKENPMWHCVYAEEQRLSVGFRINRNLL